MKTFAMTDVGRARSNNQDYIYSNELSVGHLDNLFIVADGMGGHSGGEVASSTATETIVSYINNSDIDKPVKLLQHAIEEANSKLVSMAAEDEGLDGMGTTIVAATLKDDQLYLANVGDSRLYIIHEDIEQITKDHSLVDELVRSGSISKEEARFHPKKNIITRAVGAREGILIDLFQVSLEPGDLILMCTDGLTNMLEDEDIFMMVRQQRDVAGMVERLIFAANECGGYDNISVLIIDPFSNEVRAC